jgi:hypothetical protein
LNISAFNILLTQAYFLDEEDAPKMRPTRKEGKRPSFDLKLLKKIESLDSDNEDLEKGTITFDTLVIDKN